MFSQCTMNSLSLEQGNYDSASEKILSFLNDSESDYLRDNQRDSLHRIADFWEQGKRHGLIKQPTGAGKTTLYSCLAHCLNEPTLILVPRVNLISQTESSLLGINSELDVVKISSESDGNAIVQVNAVLDHIEKKTKVIMPYQSMLSLYRNHPDVLQRLLSKMFLIVSDEGHRALGEKTTSVLKDLDKQELLSIEEERLIESLVDQGDLHHMSFTATPKLALKDVCSTYGIEMVHEVKMQNLFEDKTLVLPTEEVVGKAILNVDTDKDVRKLSNKDIASFIDEGRYIMEDGSSVINTVLQAFLNKKNELDVPLRGAGFCATIHQADQVVQRARELGLRAARVTSNKKGYEAALEPDLATEMIKNGDLDLIVTVSKVGEGWDVQELSAALWFTPTTSQARYMQAVGRIMRRLESGEYDKNSSNTFVFEPIWQIVKDLSDGMEKSKKEDDDGNKKSMPFPRKYFVESNTFYDWLIDSGEVDDEFIMRFASAQGVDLRIIKRYRIMTDVLQSIKLMSAYEWVRMSNGAKGKRLKLDDVPYRLWASEIGIECNPNATDSAHAEVLLRLLKFASTLPQKEYLDLLHGVYLIHSETRSPGATKVLLDSVERDKLFLQHRLENATTSVEDMRSTLSKLALSYREVLYGLSDYHVPGEIEIEKDIWSSLGRTKGEIEDLLGISSMGGPLELQMRDKVLAMQLFPEYTSNILSEVDYHFQEKQRCRDLREIISKVVTDKYSFEEFFQSLIEKDSDKIRLIMDDDGKQYILVEHRDVLKAYLDKRVLEAEIMIAWRDEMPGGYRTFEPRGALWLSMKIFSNTSEVIRLRILGKKPDVLLNFLRKKLDGVQWPTTMKAPSIEWRRLEIAGLDLQIIHGLLGLAGDPVKELPVRRRLLGKLGVTI